MARALVIYLKNVQPLKTPFANNIEVFNECFIMLLTYGLMCFTGFVPDPRTRFLIGWYYNGAYCLNILVHLIILVS